MRSLLTALCAGLILTAVAPTARAAEDTAADEIKLQTIGLETDGPALVKFLQQRSLTHVDGDKIQALVKDLGDKSAEKRAQAIRDLISYGSVSVPHLRKALSDPDEKEIANQARKILATLESQTASQIPLTVVRMLTQKNADGLVAALLDYAPFAEDDDVLNEIKATLADRAFGKGNKPDAAIVKALEDKMPLRRALAIEALSTTGTVEPRDILVKLMSDSKPGVRLQAALALAKGKDAKAVATLILLLAELPEPLARKAEEYLIDLAGEQAPKSVVRSDELSRQKARDAWAEWWLKYEEPKNLLEEFRKRTMNDEERTKCEALIKDLGSDDFEKREAAEKALKGKGVLVLPMIRKVASADNSDAEVRERANRCLEAIQKGTVGPLPLVMPRIVAIRKPEGAVPVLLDFLVFSEDDTTLAEVQIALNAVAYRTGKADPGLIAALADKLPVRRSAAAEALTVGGDKHAADVRKLLTDPVASVRLQTALALARNLQDKEAVPILIKLIGEMPADGSVAAEDYLTLLAAKTAPEMTGGNDETARKKRSTAWEDWWKKNEKTVSLDIPRQPVDRERFLGLTLVVSPNFACILELDKDGKEKWRINGLQTPMDAQVIGPNRVMILEAGTRMLTERNFKGEILSQVSVGNNIWPVAFQRLSSGNTLIVGNNRVIVIDKKGKEIWAHERPNSDIMNAKRIKDGSLVCVTNTGFIYRLDAQGKETKNCRFTGASYQGMDILPNGNVIYPYGNQLIELDGDGKQISTVQSNRPMDVQRLPSGNLVIGSYSPYAVIETDSKGKEISRFTLQVQPQRVKRY